MTVSEQIRAFEIAQIINSTLLMELNKADMLEEPSVVGLRRLVVSQHDFYRDIIATLKKNEGVKGK